MDSDTKAEEAWPAANEEARRDEPSQVRERGSRTQGWIGWMGMQQMEEYKKRGWGTACMIVEGDGCDVRMWGQQMRMMNKRSKSEVESIKRALSKRRKGSKNAV